MDPKVERGLVKYLQSIPLDSWRPVGFDDNDPIGGDRIKYSVKFGEREITFSVREDYWVTQYRVTVEKDSLFLDYTSDSKSRHRFLCFASGPVRMLELACQINAHKKNIRDSLMEEKIRNLLPWG